MKYTQGIEFKFYLPVQGIANKEIFKLCDTKNYRKFVKNFSITS